MSTALAEILESLTTSAPAEPPPADAPGATGAAATEPANDDGATGATGGSAAAEATGATADAGATGATAAAEEAPPAAAEMQKRWRKIQRTEAKLTKREQELEQRRTAFEADAASFKADAKALLEGDFETKSRVIQRRFGMDVVDFFDKLSKTVVPGAGKEKDDLRAELAELKKLITERDRRDQERETQSRAATEAERHFRGGTVEALSDDTQPEEIRALVELHQGGAEGLADEILTLAKERVSGQWIDPITGQEMPPVRNLTVPAMLYDLARYLRTAKGKSYLAQLRGSAEPAKGNGNGAAAKALTAPVRGKPPGTSVSPSQAVQPSVAERRMTPEEVARERRRLIHETDALEGLIGSFGEQG